MSQRRPSLAWPLLACLLVGAVVGQGCGGGADPEGDGGTPDAQVPTVPDGGEGPDGGESDGGTQPDGGWPLPETTLLSGPSGYSRVAEVTFTFAANDARFSFECSVGSADFAACATPHSFTAPEGYHYFRVRAVTPGGEVDPTPAARGFTVDTVPPETELLFGPTTEGSSVTATFGFRILGTDPGASFECALDAAAYAPCSSPRLYSGLTGGPRTFRVRAVDAAGNPDPTPVEHAWTVAAPAPTVVRVMAANLTSGNLQSYAPGHGTRIFQGLLPDVVLIQEFNHGGNTPAELRAWVDEAFGPEFFFSRESGVQLPNGVISRHPILASGTWDDPQVDNREFHWARIDVPGPIDLWAVSVHLLTSNAGMRNSEAQALVGYIEEEVPEGAFLVVGGDLNTVTRTESAISTLSQVVVTSNSASPWPTDGSGNGFTNANRSRPYDWLLADGDLAPRETPLLIGTMSFPGGLVFDSRVFTPLSAVSPILATDSAAPNMQHMPVLKDFLFPP